MGSIAVLDPGLFPVWLGWRVAFVLGAILAAFIIVLRRFLPESPRWLMIHGRLREAEDTVRWIEAKMEVAPPSEPLPRVRLSRHYHLTFRVLAHTLLKNYPRRVVLGVVLMATQAFCYNAIFFTYALILTQFYAVESRDVGWFMLPFAVGNFLGPFILGPLFDTVGRKAMIATTYAVAGVAMIIVGYLFANGALRAEAQTIAWCGIFFFASAGASAAYLTVGESFPLEARAMTIALFYAFGTGIGGIAGPVLFGALIDTGARSEIFWGYALGGGLMVFAAITETLLGVAAERKSLEDVAAPLSRLE